MFLLVIAKIVEISTDQNEKRRSKRYPNFFRSSISPPDLIPESMTKQNLSFRKQLARLVGDATSFTREND